MIIFYLLLYHKMLHLILVFYIIVRYLSIHYRLLDVILKKINVLESFRSNYLIPVFSSRVWVVIVIVNNIKIIPQVPSCTLCLIENNCIKAKKKSVKCSNEVKMGRVVRSFTTREILRQGFWKQQKPVGAGMKHEKEAMPCWRVLAVCSRAQSGVLCKR